MMSKQYEKRNHVAQDKAGNYYSRHVCAMTAEGLHAKSDIAAELAHRDIEIDRLRAELEALKQGIAPCSQQRRNRRKDEMSEAAMKRLSLKPKHGGNSAAR